MLVVPPVVVNQAVHALAHVDGASALLLQVNEWVVTRSLQYHMPAVAHASMTIVQEFDHFGSALIALVVWLVDRCAG